MSPLQQIKAKHKIRLQQPKTTKRRGAERLKGRTVKAAEAA